MSVTINDMQVDVNKPAPANNNSGESQKSKAEKPNLRAELDVRAERELRLRAD
jgi:hypothetical protein